MSSGIFAHPDKPAAVQHFHGLQSTAVVSVLGCIVSYQQLTLFSFIAQIRVIQIPAVY